MKWSVIFFVCLIHFSSVASKIETVADLDWDDPKAWAGGIVPQQPDTILIRHYITYSRDLIITAPTVLLIKREGTLCGHYLLDVQCGAQLINYGVLYVGPWKILDGYNYYIMTAINSGTITACNKPGFGKGFHIVPPEGNYNIYQFGQCKTADTKWPRESLGLNESQLSKNLVIYPVPFHDSPLRVELPGSFTAILVDALGREILYAKGNENTELDLMGISPGVYSLRIIQNNNSTQRKIVKQ